MTLKGRRRDERPQRCSSSWAPHRRRQDAAALVLYQHKLDTLASIGRDKEGERRRSPARCAPVCCVVDTYSAALSASVVTWWHTWRALSGFQL